MSARGRNARASHIETIERPPRNEVLDALARMKIEEILPPLADDVGMDREAARLLWGTKP